MYALDYEDRMPVTSYNSATNTTYEWTEFIDPYVNSKQLYGRDARKDFMLCPSLKPNNFVHRGMVYGAAFSSSDHPAGVFFTSATCNGVLSGKVKHPSSYVIFGESAYAVSSGEAAHSTFKGAGLREGDPCMRSWWTTVNYGGGRYPSYFHHGKRSNFAYVDGHVESCDVGTYAKQSKIRFNGDAITCYYTDSLFVVKTITP